ncbi:MAG: hypothetical protein HY313_10840 [Acidobacteria bacterium]|nr:hypothetical protein [Acidobacteriota bacterium]
MSSDFDLRRKTGEESELANSSVRYESEDVRAGTILKYLVALLLTVFAAQLIAWAVYRGFASSQAKEAPPLSLLRRNVRRIFPPEPRLQGSPGNETPAQEALRQMREEAEARLNSYGWVDEKAGIARVPIREAMRLLAGKGLGPAANEKAAEASRKPVRSLGSVRSANADVRETP